jgi:DNA-binding transcriptional ArsR family regulator
MQDFMTITKALADENRVRLLLALRGGQLCVCQMIELLGLAPSTVSKHLSILNQARLVEKRKEERWIYYGLVGENGSQQAKEAIAWVSKSLSKHGKVLEDARRLKQILCLDPKELCKKLNLPRSCGYTKKRRSGG